MPYKIVKRKGGFFVRNVDTGKVYSSKPMTKMDADAQLRILERMEMLRSRKK